MKLLIIDDEKAALEMLEDYFAPRGWEVLCAERAAEGLRIAHDERPDIVILDLRLPDCPGDEVLRQIKTYLPEIKVVIVTGESEEELKERVMEYGPDACFNKADLSLAGLAQTIHDLLARNNSS
jgi:DNA-binding response OmpR family regulator